MTTESRITSKLGQSLSPEHLEVLDESHMHSGPATESHYRLSIVSSAFEGLSAVKRHQRVYAILAEELAGGVHALALHTFTPEEWQDSGNTIPASPQCRGGSKADR